MTLDSDAVVSLFSGAGGFSLGFANAGLKPKFGAEIDKEACVSYENNVGSTCHNIDLSSIPPHFFSDLLNRKSPFVVIGGPPCQGFSTAGTRGKNDPRNKLIFNYLRIVCEISPRWFIFENVEGLLTSDGGTALSSLVKEFLNIGYSIRLQKVNFASYGIPQTRKRLLIVGNRMGIDFEFPEETHSFDSGKSRKISLKPFAPSMLDAFSGLGAATRSRPELARYSTKFPVNEFDRLMRAGNNRPIVSEHFFNTTTRDEEMYSLLKPGQTMKDLPESYWHESFRKRAFRRVADGIPTEKRGGAPSGFKRMNSELQCLTITGSASREFIHPFENRPLTLRECARIQTFPDSFEFHGKQASVAQQIGNAVPPLASKKFAEHLQEVDGMFGGSGASKNRASVSKPKLLGFVLTDSLGMSPALRNTEMLLSQMM